MKEGELFFRRWLHSPKEMGSVWPSSQALARSIARACAWKPGETVIELGGGTGSITEGLIESGIPPENIVVFELDSQLAGYLRDHLPGCRIVQGDATRLPELIKRLELGPVGSVVSGLPMLNMPFEFQKAIVLGGLEALVPGGVMLQYTYSPIPPVPTRKLGVRAELVRYVLRNLPPATVWRYRRVTA
jgi:phosphatidylethanolamine/phosphatidyl-N-methylethanolamine N-methyltransferase